MRLRRAAPPLGGCCLARYRKSICRGESGWQAMDGKLDGTVRGHQLASREEWLQARMELLREEKALTRRGDELASAPGAAVGARGQGVSLRCRCRRCRAGGVVSRPFATAGLSLHVRTRLHRTDAPACVCGYPGMSAFVLEERCCLSAIPPTRVVWMACGACTHGWTEHRREATRRRVPGGGATTSTNLGMPAAAAESRAAAIRFRVRFAIANPDGTR